LGWENTVIDHVSNSGDCAVTPAIFQIGPQGFDIESPAIYLKLRPASYWRRGKKNFVKAQFSERLMVLRHHPEVPSSIPREINGLTKAGQEVTESASRKMDERLARA
jgi:hypothetical protein